MEWIKLFNKVIVYIENNIESGISNKKIAEITACPAGSFKRTFSLLAGITLSEYIRRRKMTKAAFELQSTNTKVIDIAFKYGYESADAFTVAFKRMHGISPIVAKQQNIKIKSYPRLSFTLTVRGNVAMDYRVIEKKAFKVVGKMITSSLENNIIPQFWNQCKSDGTINKLLEVGLNNSTLGMCFGFDDDGFNNFMVAIETNKSCVEGMQIVDIPASTWLVFESVGPIATTLPELWKRIYGEFLPQSIYKQAKVPTMEVYDRNDTLSQDFCCEVWIPVEKS